MTASLAQASGSQAVLTSRKEQAEDTAPRISRTTTAFTRAARIAVKPALSLFGSACTYPIPWPYGIISRTVEVLSPTHPGTRTVRDRLRGTSASITAPSKPVRADRAIFYIHGGALLVCSPATHRGIIGRLADECSTTVYAPSYPMLHDAPLSDIIEHVMRAYREVRASHRHISIVGDSAGGFLSLAVLAAARKEGLAEPDSLALISPVADLDTRTTVAQFTGSDPLFPASAMRSMAMVARSAHKTRAEELGLDWDTLTSVKNPPIRITYAQGEMLRADSRRVKAMLGRDVFLDEGKGLSLHVYPVLCEVLPEALSAVHDIASFIDSSWR